MIKILVLERDPAWREEIEEAVKTLEGLFSVDYFSPSDPAQWDVDTLACYIKHYRPDLILADGQTGRVINNARIARMQGAPTWVFYADGQREIEGIGVTAFRAIFHRDDISPGSLRALLRDYVKRALARRAAAEEGAA